MISHSQQAQDDLDALRAELKKDDFDDAAIATRLGRLKLAARSSANLACVYCKDGISVLAEGVFGDTQDGRPLSSLEAARVLANAMLLKPEMQQVFADLNYMTRLVAWYSCQDNDHEFVGGRILFLLTYKSKVNFVSLVESQKLIDHVRAHLLRHSREVKHYADESKTMHSMALAESLKLLYNLTSKYPAQMHFFSSTVNILIGILNDVPIATQPLDLPIIQLLNALAIIDWPTSLSKDHEKQTLSLSSRLIDLLNRSTNTVKPAELEAALVSLLTTTRKVKELSYPKSDEFLRLSLLPQDEERDKPLGQSKTLASRLLKLQTSGGLTVLPDAISGLLFDLSDRDATKFVHNIGYGHAAGYLMTHKIPIPGNMKTATSSNGGANASPINPVTGQRLNAEVPVNMPEMTNAEKEREAERLFVLFERLKATGVIDVENPVMAAQQSGRFEELSDSEPD